MLKRKKAAFTLAEVLLVITIVGIIASYTIPPLVISTQNMDTIVRLKKTYSGLGQVAQGFETDGTAMVTVWKGSANSIRDYYLTKLINAKKGSGSWPLGFYNLKGIYGGTFDDTTETAILNDGTLLFFQPSSADCSQSQGGGIDNICGSIWADLNGFKSPNKFGRDIFIFWVTKYRTIPGG